MSTKIFFAGSFLGVVFHLILQGELSYLSLLNKYNKIMNNTSEPEDQFLPNVSRLNFMAEECSEYLSAQTGIFLDVAEKRSYSIIFDMNDKSVQLTNLKIDEGKAHTYTEENVDMFDFYIGGNVLIGDKCFTILNYGDDETTFAMTFLRQSTFAMIKPDAMPRMGEVLTEIRKYLTVADMKLVKLTTAQAQHFYQEHKERPFFNDLVSYITKSAVLALRLVDSSPVNKWRELLGPTDSAEARRNQPNTIRALFGKDKQANAAHGSDGTISALRELSLFFPNRMIVTNRVSMSSAVESVSQTSLIILPHVVKSGSLGSLITSLTSEHKCSIRSLEMETLNYLDAIRYATGELFPEDGGPNKDRVKSLLSGPVVVINLSPVNSESEEDFKTRFADIIGPQDPIRARKSSLESIRAAYGVNRNDNAVIAPYYDLKK